MSLEIKVPTVGESISEVTIGQWFKQDGDYVERDENIAELESDKATFELAAEQAGILRIKVQEGETVPIGEVVCVIETGAAPSAAPAGGNGSAKAEAKQETPKPADQGADSKPAPAANAQGGSSQGQLIDMVVPTVGESITEVTIGQWLKQDGDPVQLDEVIAEIESDKATFELPAEAAGVLRIKAQEGETLQIGALICQIEAGAGQSGSGSGAQGGSSQQTQQQSAPAQGQQAQAASQGGYASGHPSPAAGKILAEKGLSADAVKGTGVGGRITKEDAQNAQAGTQKSAQPQQQQAAASSKEQAPAATTASQGNRQQNRERMSSLRRTISRRLVSVKNETAMLTTFNEVNMKPIMDIRSKYKDQFKEKHEVGLGFMSFFTKAVTVALQEWPAVNAQIDGNEIVYNDFVDVSIAVSSPKGLVVPVVRNAESMSFAQIEKEILSLAKKARDGKLSIEEMQGGTFTITNGGVFGSMMSTPIINAPQSAILGMHNIVERPVVENGEIVIRPIMYVALSYDHRIIDGRESVSFLVRVKQLLEDPTRLLLGV
ncbi:2-oxoglutarate dehydrogenase complex dihydrolipoyllysine-residue succinyltransferase [Cesiribacter andamanensis]|uniref:Dihydrolipoyllysine-residue succinyltransferase component of 2-oxoglutarate dehydrogenase complex n=1 Tax=Cesiribacter andamanensis AMV16 TaxID=1279009 RepID=M7NZS8_9BACT|nr:2-oxoglutarate dehydrogenase complex dihydrolipoyllysine-residue succinyltransferase [Cesiribacter andamanensis]EMR03859.1 Dihydrolipoyllysine-residue succinyltransferase component of 2-oxoglutarate dehydrogenase complex [Cesiribacter andamanensis AMV16]